MEYYFVQTNRIKGRVFTWDEVKQIQLFKDFFVLINDYLNEFDKLSYILDLLLPAVYLKRVQKVDYVNKLPKLDF